MMRKAVLACLGAVALLIGVTLTALAPPPAAAASLVQVTNFGNNPSGLQMHIYVPDRVVTPRAPILVAVHYCTGSGPVFFSGTEFARLADQFGFIVIYPTATRSSRCFDVYTAQALRRNGGSDPVGIKSMIDWTVANRNGDPNRVYVTGASSGAMMTNVLLGDYPDVFKAGAAFMGVPATCFATTPPNEWNSDCANGTIIRTAQQWGDAARAMNPGYTGPRPRMQIWHGTADTTLRFPNFGEQLKQWTNVLGVSQTPSFTDTPQSGWTRTRYGGTGVQAPVEAIRLENVGHNLPLGGQARMAIDFFGLSTSIPPTSTTTTTTTTGNPPPGGCTVRDDLNAWNTGLTSTFTLTNTSTTPINGWTLTFTLPTGQTITSGWNATYTPTTGHITARNTSFNAMINPNGGTVSGFGFQATHTGNTAKPTSFTLNGTPCTVA
ncbi:MAG TPA: PHB depolymerase family esterase [Actinophytocola sp.]|uniref:extracellular catalytic domain type 1 short-chain-length polyhydroxyalkanoate depolymerase n=1 Tax=Actinophytocola sp. TaxID=1872138 RepID=UPI002DDCECB0|nr:PHB depolymerase family esterase [Actinophytocola sp.]HEV2778429.1 PHB depolymerase family esterase [Actinophytocola sp.]